MKQIIILVLSTILFGCSVQKKPIDYSAYTISKEELSKISLKAILTTGLDKNNDPIDNVTEFKLNEKLTVTAYLSWFDIVSPKKYYIKLKWYSPDNEMYEQNDYTLNSEAPTWYSWHYITFEDKLTPRGQYKIKIYLNNEYIKDLNFTIK